MTHFMESLESRSMLSVVPVGAAVLGNLASVGTFQPMLATPTILGKYAGKVNIPGVSHLKGITVTITKQTSLGLFYGYMYSTNDRNIKIAIAGKVGNTRKFTIRLKGGTHVGGDINATGTGSVSRDGRTLTASLNFTQSGMVFPGTFSITKV